MPNNVLARAVVVLGGDSRPLDREMAKAQARVRQMGSQMQEIGRGLSTRVTLPLLAIAGAGTFAAAKFDESMRRMAALVGIPQEQLNEWRDDIRDMATDFGRSADEAADAMFFITSAGIKADEAMSVLRASLTGAAIGLGETKVIADAATSAMNAYKNAGLTATRATEILAAAVKFGKLEAEQLAPVIGSLVGTSSALGISFEDVAGVLAVFSRTGTDAAMGATQINAIMSLLLGTSAEGEEALRSVGMSLEDLRKVAAGPGGLISVMRVLDEAFAGNLDMMKTVIPNVRAFRGVMNALAQDGTSVDEVMQGVADSTGILETALVESEGPMLQLRRSWQRMSDALVDIGTTVIPVVVPTMEAISTAIAGTARAFRDLPEGIRTGVVVFGALAAALGPVLVTLGGLVRLIPILQTTLVTGLVSPVGLAVAALAALTTAGIVVVSNWSFVKSQIIAAWTAIKVAFFEGIDLFLELGEKLPVVGDRIAELRAELNEFAEKNLAEAGEKLFQLDQEMGFFPDTVDTVTESVSDLNEETEETAKSFDEMLKAMGGIGDTILATETAARAGIVNFKEELRLSKEEVFELFRLWGRVKKPIEETVTITEQLKQGFVDLTVQGVNSFVDAVFDAGATFGSVFKQMLVDVAKLTAKILILRGLTSAFPTFFGGGLLPGFAKGGFMPGGSFGIVGEEGPELVAAGRHGLSVLPAAATASVTDDSRDSSSLEMPSVTFTFPPRRSHTDMARDPEIARGFLAQLENAWSNGWRPKNR